MKSAWLPSEKWFLALSSLVTLGFGALGVGLSRDTRPQVTIPPHAPLPVPNGLDLYVAAAVYSRSVPPVDPNSDRQFLKLSLAQKRARYSFARRAAWEKSAAPAWAFFKQAQAARSLQGRQNSFGAYRSMHQLALDKVALANTCTLRGDWSGALANDLDVVQMGHDFARGGGAFALSLGSAFGNAGTDGAQHAGARIGTHLDASEGVLYDDIVPHLDAAQARAGARRLEALIQAAPKFSDALREEKYANQELWLQMWNQPAEGQNSFQAFMRPQEQMFQTYSHAVDEFIAVADQPFGTHATWPQLVFPVAAQVEFAPRSIAFNIAVARAKEEQLLLRLALRAYRLEHGAPPAKLSDLSSASAILTRIPLDPFGQGEKWRTKNGVAWSVGPDGKDDGGKSIPIKLNSGRIQISETALGDIVARG